MTTRCRFPAIVLAMAAGAIVAASTNVRAQAPRPGPGAKDAFPNGCVDCHVAGKDSDMRLSVLVATWATAVPPALVEKAKAASADPSKIKGKHPAVPAARTSLIQTCAGACHRKGSTIAPPFSQLLHTIHLVGPGNRFLTVHQGDCTHCHKLDQKTGAWRLPTGNEK
jgi:hypothetical protein